MSDLDDIVEGVNGMILSPRSPRVVQRQKLLNRMITTHQLKFAPGKHPSGKMVFGETTHLKNSKTRNDVGTDFTNIEYQYVTDLGTAKHLHFAVPGFIDFDTGPVVCKNNRVYGTDFIRACFYKPTFNELERKIKQLDNNVMIKKRDRDNADVVSVLLGIRGGGCMVSDVHELTESEIIEYIKDISENENDEKKDEDESDGVKISATEVGTDGNDTSTDDVDGKKPVYHHVNDEIVLEKGDKHGHIRDVYADDKLTGIVGGLIFMSMGLSKPHGDVSGNPRNLVMTFREFHHDYQYDNVIPTTTSLHTSHDLDDME